MSFVIIAIVSFLTGIFASMGLGGGMVLIIYLTIFASTPQLAAQGINLVFFIPIAIISLIIHTKNKLIEWKKIAPSIICGTIGVFIGSMLATKLGSEKMSKLFAVFLIVIGIREITKKISPESCSSCKQDSSQG